MWMKNWRAEEFANGIYPTIFQRSSCLQNSNLASHTVWFIVVVILRAWKCKPNGKWNCLKTFSRHEIASTGQHTEKGNSAKTLCMIGSLLLANQSSKVTAPKCDQEQHPATHYHHSALMLRIKSWWPVPGIVRKMFWEHLPGAFMNHNGLRSNQHWLPPAIHSPSHQSDPSSL